MALENACFRRVLFTGRHYQLALMTLRPGEETGLERHDEGDQFVRVAAGEGEVILNGGVPRCARARRSSCRPESSTIS
jgi:quercetin dioxygenase-like cupin family protein